MSTERPFREQPGQPDTLRHDPLTCPACGYVTDAVGSEDGAPLPRPPGDGDYLACFRCTMVNVVQVSPLGVVSVRSADELDMALFARKPDNVRMLRRLQAFRATHPYDAHE